MKKLNNAAQQCYIRYNYEFWVFILMQKFQDGDAKNLLLENEDTLVEFDRGAGTRFLYVRRSTKLRWI